VIRAAFGMGVSVPMVDADAVLAAL